MAFVHKLAKEVLIKSAPMVRGTLGKKSHVRMLSSLSKEEEAKVASHIVEVAQDTNSTTPSIMDMIHKDLMEKLPNDFPGDDHQLVLTSYLNEISSNIPQLTDMRIPSEEQLVDFINQSLVIGDTYHLKAGFMAFLLLLYVKGDTSALIKQLVPHLHMLKRKISAGVGSGVDEATKLINILKHKDLSKTDDVFNLLIAAFPIVYPQLMYVPALAMVFKESVKVILRPPINRTFKPWDIRFSSFKLVRHVDGYIIDVDTSQLPPQEVKIFVAENSVSFMGKGDTPNGMSELHVDIPCHTFDAQKSTCRLEGSKLTLFLDIGGSLPALTFKVHIP